jgi:hypothetical protein
MVVTAALVPITALQILAAAAAALGLTEAMARVALVL